MKYIVCLLMILLLSSPVMALENVTNQSSSVIYSQDYYNFVNACNKAITDMFSMSIVSTYEKAKVLEMHRQSMLMEKQNELIAEQNAILRNMTSKKLVCSKWKSHGEYGLYVTCVEWTTEA